MNWSIVEGDILDVEANILICPANPYLNLSGGVDGALLLRYGPELQQVLHQRLKAENRRYLNQGDIVVTEGFQTQFDWIIHAVAIDAFYDTTAGVVEELLVKCIKEADTLRAKLVAMSALATGYGRQSMEFFAKTLTTAASTQAQNIEQIVVCVRKQEDAEILRDSFLQKIGVTTRPKF